MKKTISISLAQTQFHLEDDAYIRLDQYLSSIRHFFALNPDKEEILKDIESRFAELLLDYTRYTNRNDEVKERIVTLEHIETLIKSMGTVEDFAEADTLRHEEHPPMDPINNQAPEHMSAGHTTNQARTEEPRDHFSPASHENADYHTGREQSYGPEQNRSHTSYSSYSSNHSQHSANSQQSTPPHKSAPTGAKKNPKKLYRDTDNGMIAGVCAGLAMYTGLQVTWMRVIFLITLLFGGTGVIIYIILWIAMPEAITASQKLEMRGDPVTLESMSEMVKEKIEEIKSKKEEGRKIAKGPIDAFMRAVRRIAQFFGRQFFPLIARIIHYVLSFAVICAFIAVISGLIIASINFPDTFFENQLRDLLSPITYQLVLLTGFVLISIPLIFIASVSKKIGDLGRPRNLVITSDPTIRRRLTWTLLTLWTLAIIAGISVSMSAVQQYWTNIAHHPKYALVDKNIDLGLFDKIIVENGQSVTLKTAPAGVSTTTITIKAQAKFVEQVVIENKEGTLRVSDAQTRRECFFCSYGPVKIEITAPRFTHIEARNGSRIRVDENEVTGKEHVLSLGTTMIRASNASRIELSVDSQFLDLFAENASRIRIIGKTNGIQGESKNVSRIDIGDLVSATPPLLKSDPESRILVPDIPDFAATSTNSQSVPKN